MRSMISGTRISRAVLVVLALTFAAGCGSDGDDTEGAAALEEIGDGASAGESVQALVTPDGEATLTLMTGAKLSIGKDSLDKDTMIGLARPKDAKAVELVKTVQSTDKLASAPYVLTPHGTKFKKAVQLELPVAKNAKKDKLVFAWLEDEGDTKWKTAGVAQVDGDKATIGLEHFSVLILLERETLTGGEIRADGGGPSASKPDAGSPDAEPSFDAGSRPIGGKDAGTDTTDPTNPGSADASTGVGGDHPDAGTVCKSDFNCAIHECGTVWDSCGINHDVAAECGTSPCGSYLSYERSCMMIMDGPQRRNACILPCSAPTDCPPEVSMCLDSVTLYIESWACNGGGYCDGNQGTTECQGICTGGGCASP
jgi:hypothetical protein